MNTKPPTAPGDTLSVRLCHNLLLLMLMLSRTLLRHCNSGGRKIPTGTKHYSTAAPYDAVIVGAGHNGLVCGSYLARAGKRVLVLERRHIVGGAAISEEVMPGFTCSRASYLLSLMRPHIMRDLKLDQTLRLLPRNPTSFSPVTQQNKYLMLGSDPGFNKDQVSKFSKRDAQNLEPYEQWLEKYASSVEKLLDEPPIDPSLIKDQGLWSSVRDQSTSICLLMEQGAQIGLHNAPELWELLTAPASKVRERERNEVQCPFTPSPLSRNNIDPQKMVRI